MLAAVVNENTIVNAIVWLVCIGLIFYVLYWLIGALKVPEPISRIALGLIALAAAVICIRILFKFAGNPF